MITFELKPSKDDNPPYIELNKLLKALQLTNSGAMSNKMIEQGIVKLNGNLESRKRAKIRKGDQVQFEDKLIEII